MIKNHQYTLAKSAPSPSFTDRVIEPKFVVMHYTASWGVKSVIDTFANPDRKVSAQFTIDTDGTVYQHVAANKRAWHAGPSLYNGVTDLNSHAIGIEFVNVGFLKKVGDDLYEDHMGGQHTSAKIGDMVAAKQPRVGGGTYYWPAYTEAQLAAGEELVKAIDAAYGIDAIVTHEEIDTRGWKTDPGPAFPLDRFAALLGKAPAAVVHYEVTAESLNVRKGPGTKNIVVAKLPRGASVDILSRKGDWVEIEKGWVNGDFLRPVV